MIFVFVFSSALYSSSLHDLDTLYCFFALTMVEGNHMNASPIVVIFVSY
jgi:hypothetical protein